MKQPNPKIQTEVIVELKESNGTTGVRRNKVFRSELEHPVKIETWPDGSAYIIVHETEVDYTAIEVAEVFGWEVKKVVPFMGAEVQIPDNSTSQQQTTMSFNIPPVLVSVNFDTERIAVEETIVSKPKSEAYRPFGTPSAFPFRG